MQERSAMVLEYATTLNYLSITEKIHEFDIQR